MIEDSPQTNSPEYHIEQKTEQAYACDLSEESLRQLLTPEQYRIVRMNGTERPFDNQFWNHSAEGIYVDIVSGEPLFCSTSKFRSASGWPSFFAPINADSIVERSDKSHGMERTEIRSRTANSHLGHVFPDGPHPTGLRYCINSASLRFVPRLEMQESGYGHLLHLFDLKQNDKVKDTDT